MEMHSFSNYGSRFFDTAILSKSEVVAKSIFNNSEYTNTLDQYNYENSLQSSYVILSLIIIHTYSILIASTVTSRIHSYYIIFRTNVPDGKYIHT